jgi:hypothetical protein
MKHTPNSLWMMNPPQYGDTITICGKDWTLKQGGYGWHLRDSAGNIHPRIKDIPAMSDLIYAIKNDKSAIAEFLNLK